MSPTRLVWLVCRLLVSVLIVETPLSAQERRNVVVTGVVVDSALGQPIVGAQVGLPDLNRATVTDSTGDFRIDSVPAGAYRLVVRHVGFRVVEMRITVVSNDIDRRIILGRSATVLESVFVKAPSSSGIKSFDENKRVGLGHFLTRADLAKLGAATFSEVLSNISGVGILRGTGDQGWIHSRRMTPSSCPPVTSYGPPARPPQAVACLQGQGVYVPARDEHDRGVQPVCYAQVYLDNVLMNPARPTEPFDVNTLKLEQLEAVEFYAGPSQTPSKYSGLDSRCGVLVLWTRR